MDVNDSKAPDMNLNLNVNNAPFWGHRFYVFYDFVLSISFKGSGH